MPDTPSWGIYLPLVNHPVRSAVEVHDLAEIRNYYLHSLRLLSPLQYQIQSTPAIPDGQNLQVFCLV